MKKMSFMILMLNLFISVFALDGVDRCCNFKMASLPVDTVTPIKIQLEKTHFNDMTVIFVSDTAKHLEELNQ